MKVLQKLEPVIEPEGDRCLILRYGTVLDAETSSLCLLTAQRIEQAGLAGVQDVIPSFTTVAVHYEPSAFGGQPYAALCAAITGLLRSGNASQSFQGRTVRVPVCYDAEFAMDLDYVADTCELTRQQVIDLHTSDPVSVFALGFAPGLPYIGVHNEKFNLPRRATPRTAVPGGSVAIANRQSVIYPNTSPGGWHVIGAMPYPLFDPDRTPYTFLLPGDSVRFTAISRREFDRLQQAGL
jgi:KipI family sensor histidine kinase inhibitor